MIPDPTTEIKRIRHQLGADDGFDLDRIFARIRRLQDASGRKCVRRPSRTPADNNPMHGSGEVGRFQMDNQTSPPRDR